MVQNTDIVTCIHPFYSPLDCLGLPRWAGSRTNLDFTEARDSEWQWHQLGRMQIYNSPQTDNHSSTTPLSFITGWMPFLPPNQQCQSTEGIQSTDGRYNYNRRLTGNNVLPIEWHKYQW